MKLRLILFIVILLSLFLRLYSLNGYPPSFWQDITANAYDAYSLLQTGKDQWGATLPFPLIKSLGDYKMALPVYFLIPGIKFFGLNEFGVRLDMAVTGVLTVLIAYFLGKKIGKNRVFGLILALLIAISPWHIGLTRSGWEATVGIPLFLLGLYFFWPDSIKKPASYIISSLFFGLASYTYHPYRVFVPLFFFLALCIFLKENLIARKWFLISLSIFLLYICPIFSVWLVRPEESELKLIDLTKQLNLPARPKINRSGKMI